MISLAMPLYQTFTLLPGYNNTVIMCWNEHLRGGAPSLHERAEEKKWLKHGFSGSSQTANLPSGTVGIRRHLHGGGHWLCPLPRTATADGSWRDYNAFPLIVWLYYSCYMQKECDFFINRETSSGIRVNVGNLRVPSSATASLRGLSHKQWNRQLLRACVQKLPRLRLKGSRRAWL